jgi:hypothetical protein
MPLSAPNEPHPASVFVLTSVRSSGARPANDNAGFCGGVAALCPANVQGGRLVSCTTTAAVTRLYTGPTMWASRLQEGA